MEDEVIREAIPALGYVHRGLEKPAEIRDFHQMVQIVERVCGICSMMHAMCYCQCIEDLMGIEVPPRAHYLRVVWSELHRIHCHRLWLGLFADAFGFESLFMQLWKIRERVMDLQEATAGNRVIVSVNVVGGLRRDLSTDQQQMISRTLAGMPGGEISAKVKGRPEGEGIARVEQPRGEVLYYIRAGGGKYLDRVRSRTPTFANVPVLVAMLPGMYLSDVPVIVLSIDPCISCTER